MAQLITSQHFLDEAIIAAKLSASDFDVLASPVFELDGEEYQVVLDGNHSLAAAIEAGVAPQITIADVIAHDAVGILNEGRVLDFLDAVHMGEGDYIDALSRRAVW